MNRGAFLLVAWIALGLELSLRPALALGSQGIGPSFVFCALTLCAMFAPPGLVRWTALLLGLAMDLLTPLPAHGPIELRVIGPTSLAYIAGVQVILAVRGATIRRNPLTLGFLAFVGLLTAQLVLVVLLALRSWTMDDLAFSAGRELLVRSGEAAYTGILACVLALGLLPLAPLLGLQVGVQVVSGRAARV
jgi:cell shape-determining protein MreD